MSTASVPAKKKIFGVMVAVSLLLVLWMLWSSKKPVYPVPDLISFSGGRYVQKTLMQELEALEHRRQMGFDRFQLTLGVNESGGLYCQSPQANPMLPARGAALCSEESLRGWLEANLSLRLIIAMEGDVIGGFEKLKSVIPDYGARVLVQLEQLGHVETLRSMGYTQFAWVVRDVRIEPEELLHALDGIRVNAVVLPAFNAKEELLYELRRKKLQVYVYLIDDCETFSAMKNIGVHAVYTSDLDPESCEIRPSPGNEDKAKQLLKNLSAAQPG